MAKKVPREILEDLFKTAVQSVQPATCMKAHLPDPPISGRVIVIGAGKASAAMALALEKTWTDQPLEGIVICPYGSKTETQHIEVIEAGHPVADDNGIAGTRQIVELTRSAQESDLVLALISGGGSALLTLPAAGLALDEHQKIMRALLQSGARIQDINVVRKHLSAVKGGRLGQMATPARLVTLAISDVVGDAPEVIASGPTVPDSSHASDALKILDRFSIALPSTVTAALQNSQIENMSNMPIDFRLIAKPEDALKAAAHRARQQGLESYSLGDHIEGDAQETGRRLAQQAIDLAAQGWRGVILSGGEVTTNLETMTEAAEGGPSRETALSFATKITGQSQIAAIFADTDGVDGRTSPTDPIAGAYVDGNTAGLGRTQDREAAQDLLHHQSGDFFESVGQSIRTGPTQTNVNDFRAILIGDAGA